MATIYSGIDGLDVPDIMQASKIGFDKYLEQEDPYREKLQVAVKKIGTCPEAGEIISFPVADGRAMYVILSLKPVKLVHVATGDAYEFQYAHRLTAADVRIELKKAQTMTKLFGRKGSILCPKI